MTTCEFKKMGFGKAKRECEFKKECETAIVGKCTHPEWRIEEDDCPHRKFAILVVNRTVEKVLNYISVTHKAGKDTDQFKQTIQALKMEED